MFEFYIGVALGTAVTLTVSYCGNAVRGWRHRRREERLLRAIGVTPQ